MSNYNQGNWRDTAYNTLSASYSYGYAGCRTDLPSTGYDPVYPDISSAYQQQSQATRPPYTYFTSNGVYQTDYSQPAYEEYNPENPGFHNSASNSHGYGPSSSLIAVNSSAFSIRNYVKPRKAEKKKRTEDKPKAKIGHSAAGKVAQLISQKVNPVKALPLKSPVFDKLSTAPVTNISQMRGRGQIRGVINKSRAQNQQRPNFNIGPVSFRGRPSFYRGGSNGGYNQRRRPQNSLYDHKAIPFSSLEDHDEKLSFVLDFENLFLFSGPSSVFTPQHNFPLLVEGHIYESIDHFYQVEKVKDLCGTIPAELENTIRDRNGCRKDGKAGFRSSGSKSFSQLAREFIKSKGITKMQVDEWRNSKGLDCLQIGFLAKVAQSAHIREAIKETAHKIMVHAFQGDAVFGAGTHAGGIRKWVETMKKHGSTSFMIPGVFPLTDETVQKCPMFAEGRNILGVILMQLRKKLTCGQIEYVDMTTVIQNLQTGGAAQNKNEENVLDPSLGDGFSIGGGNLQPKLGDLHII